MTAPAGTTGLVHRLAELARTLAVKIDADADSTELLTHALSLICEIVPGTRWASLTQRQAQLRTVAASDTRATTLDELQYRTGKGPCLSALDDTTMVVSDFAVEGRWPEFTKLVQANGLATGSLSYSLADVGHSDISLNLYTDVEGAGERIDQVIAGVVVPLLAIVLTAAHQRHSIRHLEIGLTTSRSIGAAVGVLMSRHQWTYDQAFEALRTASQHGHRRLRDIAADVVLIGELPG